jgi:hypothetical protein
MLFKEVNYPKYVFPILRVMPILGGTLGSIRDPQSMYSSHNEGIRRHPLHSIDYDIRSWLNAIDNVFRFNNLMR